MTILIDSRVGSKHLAPLIRNSELTQLESGDAAFSSVDGRLIGVEVKKLNDAVQCMYTGRLADEQIPKMRATYDVNYLIIEGVYRPEPLTGVLQLWREFDSSKDVKCGRWQDVQSGRKRLMCSQFESWLMTMSTLGGVLVRNSGSTVHTASLLVAMYNWYQREDHHSFDTMHLAEGMAASMARPGTLRRVLAEVDIIGWTRSGNLRPRFKGFKFIRKDGRDATPEDFVLVKTRKDGVDFQDISLERATEIVRKCAEAD